ncbi:hypothetical protein WISP_102183 [Willisornis vidua]|uniref:Uncharacterized protein n=1 Tax=Willisornis vidua TaxID=1566151 RepID=A0ABQ9D339_9PASS|nr:hypothetical protein WISP_102183 [Willisornis vidua]
MYQDYNNKTYCSQNKREDPRPSEMLQQGSSRDGTRVVPGAVFKDIMDTPNLGLDFLQSNVNESDDSFPIGGFPAFKGVNRSSQVSVSEDLLSIPSSPASKSLMKMMKRPGPKIEPCGTPLVTGNQPDVTSFTITLCARPMNQLLTHCMMCLSSCAGHFVQKDPMRDSIESFIETKKDYINWLPLIL